MVDGDTMLAVLSTVTPVQVIRPQTPYLPRGMNAMLQQQHLQQMRHQLHGMLHPNDDAFVDMVLEEGEGGRLSDLVELDMTHQPWGSRQEFTSTNTSRGSSFQRGTAYRNVLLYKGRPIWTLETSCGYNKRGTWGQKSTCLLCFRTGQLRVIIVHKGRQANGEGYNTVEKRSYSLASLISASGRLRLRQMNDTPVPGARRVSLESPMVENKLEDEDSLGYLADGVRRYSFPSATTVQ